MSPSDQWRRAADEARGRTEHTAFRAGRGCLWAAAVLTAKVAMGWLLGARRVAATVDPSHAMKLNSALVLLAFACTGLYETRRGARPPTIAARIVGVVMAVGGALVLVEHVFDVSLSIDELVHPDPWTVGPLAPGRPAPQAAVAILCLGLAVLVPRWWVSARDALVVAALTAGFLGLVGHLFDVEPFVVVGGGFGLPVEASLALVLSSTGFALTRPHDATRLTGAFADSPGGVLVRRIVPLAVLVPIGGAAIQQALTTSSLVADRTATWVVSLLAVAVALVAVAKAAGAADRQGAELAAERSRYGELFDSVPDGIYETRLDGAIVVANDALAEMLHYDEAHALMSRVDSVESLWVHPEHRRELTDGLLAGRRSGHPDIELRRADGSVITAALSFRAVTDEHDVVVGLRGTLRDVTQDRAREAQLAEAEERFRLAFESGPLGRAMLDLTASPMAFIEVNDALADLLGHPVAELTAIDPLELVHPDDLDGEVAALASCMAGRETQLRYESRRRHRDGSWISVAVTGAVLAHEDGSPRYLMCTLEDIGPRLAATAALALASAQAEDRARQALALKRLALAVLESHDLAALDELASDLVTATLGVDAVAVYERDEADLWLLTRQHGIGGGLGALDASSLSGGTGDSPAVASLVAGQLAGSGREAAVTVDGSSAIIVATREGRPVSQEEVAFIQGAAALLGLARAREETRARLVRSERTLTALVDNAPSAVYLFDPDGRCLVANAESARVAGLTSAEMVGRTRAEMPGLDARAVVTHRVNDLEVLAAGSPCMVEETALRDGVEVTYLTVKFPLVDEAGRPFGVGGISTDISEIRRLEGESKRAWNETLRRIATAVELRDEETGGHVERMSAYAALIASHLGLSADRVTDIGVAAQLHDAGKIGIPDEILLKPGSFTAEERRIMETHATIGYELLAGTGSELLDLAATIAWTHHERVDGSGYPRHLRGDEIPIEGRIAAVADVFDALTSNRIYRPAMPLDDALAILRDGRGRAFDPIVLDALLDNLDEAVAISLRHADPAQIIGRSARWPRSARPDQA